MTYRNIAGERFQLLSTFKAILDQGNVVKAAEVQGMTQSAASKHLQKLRVWFNDELFARTTQGMEPTPKALSIIDQVETILHEMAQLTTSSHFDPAELQGNFTLSITDDISQCILSRLLIQLGKQAPKLRLSVVRWESDYSIQQLETGRVNLVISVNWNAPKQLMQKYLCGDRSVCLMSKSHPLADKILTLDDYANARHIMVAPLGKEQGYVDDLLHQQGHKRFVHLSVPDFSGISYDLLGDQSIVTLPHRVAENLAASAPFVIKPLPFDAPNINYYMFWHRRFNRDNTTAWIRDLVQTVLKD